MKKITWWLLSTATALILLFSYHTSTDSVAATTPPSISTPATKAATRVTTATATTTVTATVTAGGGSAPTTAAGADRSTSAATPSTTAAATTSSSEAPTTQAAGASGTFTGDAVDTRFGPVQVQITVESGQITSATALQYPYNDHRDQEINDYAIPVLNQEAVDGQSANISMVSGATYTSDGYLQSLQSAIDQAHL